MEQYNKVISAGKNRSSSIHGRHRRQRKKKIDYGKYKKKKTCENRVLVHGDNKKEPYRIIENNIDCTPHFLHDNTYMSIDETTISAVDSMCRSDSFHNFTATLSQMSIVSPKQNLRSRSAFSLGDSESLTNSIQKTEANAMNVPSMFRLRADPPPKILPVPRKILIRLKETNTMFLLNFESTAADRTLTDAVEEIVKDNETYEIAKLKSKKICSVQSQTGSLMFVTKCKYAFIERVTRANSYAFAAAWDIYDCLKTLGELNVEGNSIASRNISNATIMESESMPHDCIKPNQILSSMKFLNSVMFMERVLVSGYMSDKQHLFNGLLAPNPYKLDIFQFNYRLELLLTLQNDECKGMTINAISWNSKNIGLVAVGYGKYEYNEQRAGIICCWNVKNPQYPERQYCFPTPVTSLCFSSQHPHILVASFYDGLVIMLNTNFREIVLMGKSKTDFLSSYEPVWQVCWFPKEDNPRRETPVSCGQNGKIVRYMKDGIITATCILPVIRMEGRIKGIKMTKKCHSEDIALSQYPAVLCIATNPNNPLLYIIGTDEGCIYHCSVSYFHQHLSMTLAHNGPVYSVQYHPFCPKVFMSAGADWCVRVWADGIFEPLITLISGMQPVLQASWSPSNATLIACITGTYIELWDIRRKTYTPVSSTCSPSNNQYTKLMFTNRGLNLSAGDRNGNVNIFALAEMPYAPMNQQNAILFAIKKAMASQPRLLKELRKIGEPFDIL